MKCWFFGEGGHWKPFIQNDRWLLMFVASITYTFASEYNPQMYCFPSLQIEVVLCLPYLPVQKCTLTRNGVKGRARLAKAHARTLCICEDQHKLVCVCTWCVLGQVHICLRALMWPRARKVVISCKSTPSLVPARIGYRWTVFHCFCTFDISGVNVTSIWQNFF